MTVALATALLTAACGSSTSSGSPSAGSGKTLTVGVSSPVTGPLAINNEATQGLIAYFKYRDAHGGVDGYRLNASVVDNQSTVSGGAAAAHKILASDPFAIATISTGAFVGAEGALRAASGTPVFALASGADVTAGHVPTAFGLYTDYTTESFAGIDSLIRMGHRKIALVYDPTFAAPAASRDAAYAHQHGGSLVANINLPASSTNYSPVVEKIKASGADGVEVLIAQQGAAGLVKAAQQAGLHVTMMGYSGLLDSSTIKLAGSAINGMYMTGFFPLLTDPSSAVKLFNAQVGRYESNADTELGLVGWNAGAIVADGVAKALDGGKKLTGTSVMTALASLSGQRVGVIEKLGWTASYRASLDGADPGAFSIYRVENGTFVKLSG